jgi:hypothetical protein
MYQLRCNRKTKVGAIMKRHQAALLVLSLVFLLVGCGGGGGGGDDESASSAEGRWSAGNLVFTGNGGSQEMPDFRIIIRRDEIAATADDAETGEGEWWNWGPAQYTQTSHNIAASNIPEVEGGSTVQLSLNLTLESDTLITGTVAIDWWVAEQNTYWHSEAAISATKQ